MQRDIRADRGRRTIRPNDERRHRAARLHLHGNVHGLSRADIAAGRAVEEKLAGLRAQRCRERTGEHLRQCEVAVALRLNGEAVRERAAPSNRDIAGNRQTA